MPPMKDQTIVCFAKDWNEDPTSCNHVLGGLAENNKVVWINSIASRAPNLTSGRDLKKIASRLKYLFNNTKQVGDQMWLITPTVLPFNHIPAVIKLNKFLLQTQINTLLKKIRAKKFQLWTFYPLPLDYIDTLNGELFVYYCTDNWSKFSAMNSQTGNMVENLAKRADLVFATSNTLVEKLKGFNEETHLSSHGVSYELFATALEDSTPIPDDMKDIPSPRLGFYGLIEDWMDQNLVAYLAERHPEWSIVLIGKSLVDTSKLEKYSNIHFLGRKPHDQLAAYCKGFAVGLIPHQVNELTIHMNPIKLREYLSAGLPIVSTALPEMRNFPESCVVAESYEEFEAGIEKFLRDTPEERRKRSKSMAEETWEHKVARIGSIIDSVRRKKGL